jgi:ubiquitin-like protein Pup
MGDQERKTKRSPGSEQEDAPATPVASTNVAEKGAKLKKSLDELIDEIDGVLEENAEEFVKSYVQRGGE